LNQYEAMFLFDPTYATDFQNAKAEVERILERAGAEIVFLTKWDERKLAYEIKGRKRGCYVLLYFKCPPEGIGKIERDARLSEPVLRILITRADGVTQEHIDRLLPGDRSADVDALEERADKTAPPEDKGATEDSAEPKDRGEASLSEAKAEEAKEEAPSAETEPTPEPAPEP
jgi:small subunit ribosomal protein S6